MKTIKCERCNKELATCVVKNLGGDKRICGFCEEENDEFVEAIIENQYSEDEPEFGRLHLINKPRTEKICRECKIELLKGIPRFTQSIKQIPFPIPSCVCWDCGQKQIVNGVEVAPPKKKE